MFYSTVAHPRAALLRAAAGSAAADASDAEDHNIMNTTLAAELFDSGQSVSEGEQWKCLLCALVGLLAMHMASAPSRTGNSIHGLEALVEVRYAALSLPVSNLVEWFSFGMCAVAFGSTVHANQQALGGTSSWQVIMHTASPSSANCNSSEVGGIVSLADSSTVTSLERLADERGNVPEV